MKDTINFFLSYSNSMINKETHSALVAMKDVCGIELNRKCQDNVYIKCEYWSTMMKIKHY